MTTRLLVPRLLLCLALGLLTTIAIAWTSAAFAHDFEPTNQLATIDTEPMGEQYVAATIRFRAGQRTVWDPETFDRSPVRPGMVPHPALADPSIALPLFVAAGKFPPWWGRVPDVSAARAFRGATWVQDARGWPVLAHCCDWYYSWDTPHQRPVRAFGGIDLPDIEGADLPVSSRALPYRPVPLGLSADTLLFALAWSALLYAPRAIRTHIRARRGLCTSCSYDLSGLPPGALCPECGKGVGV